MSLYATSANYPYATTQVYGYQTSGRPAANQWVPRQNYYLGAPQAQFAPPLLPLANVAAPMVESVAQVATQSILPKALAAVAGVGVAGGGLMKWLKSNKVNTKPANNATYTPPTREVETLPIKGPAGAFFKDVLFITTQRTVKQGGGLGQYCAELPEAMNRMGFDVRTISPYDGYEKSLDKELPEAERSVVVGDPYKVKAGQDEYTLVLRKRKNPETNGWAYMVECDDLFVKETAQAKLKSILAREAAAKPSTPAQAQEQAKATQTHSYTGGNQGPGVQAKPTSPEADPTKMVSFLNLAAKHFLLDKGLARQSENLIQGGKGKSWKPEVLHLNEFSGGEIVGQLSPEALENYAKGWVLHNQHDAVSPMQNISKMGLKIPTGLEGQSHYSRTDVGLRFTDIVFASVPYAQRLQEWIPGLKKHLQQGTVVNTYHGSAVSLPQTGHALEKYGFKMLPKSFTLMHADPKVMYSAQQVKDIQAFKGAENKRAFQKLFAKGWEAKMSGDLKLKPGGYLKEDPKAVLYTMVSRIDPYQKGWLNAINTMKDFLKANPHAQLFLGGAANCDPQLPLLHRQLDKLTKDPELAGRVVTYTDWMKGDPLDMAMAASDFDIHPSIFEPFGMHNFRVNQWGSVPILRFVDGLAVSGYDPDYQDDQKLSVAKSFGQTCLFADPVNNMDHHNQLLDKLIRGTESLKQGEDKPKNLLTAEEKAVLTHHNQTLRNALDRSMALAQDSEKMAKVRLQGLNYVYTKHYMWEDVVKNVYIKGYNQVLQEKAQKQARQTQKLDQAA